MFSQQIPFNKVPRLGHERATLLSIRWGGGWLRPPSRKSSWARFLVSCDRAAGRFAPGENQLMVCGDGRLSKNSGSLPVVKGVLCGRGEGNWRGERKLHTWGRGARCSNNVTYTIVDAIGKHHQDPRIEVGVGRGRGWYATIAVSCFAAGYWHVSGCSTCGRYLTTNPSVPSGSSTPVDTASPTNLSTGPPL